MPEGSGLDFGIFNKPADSGKINFYSKDKCLIEFSNSETGLNAVVDFNLKQKTVKIKSSY